MISIKITGLINMHTLKLLNDAVAKRDKFWNDNQLNGKLNSERIFAGLQQIYAGITETQLQNYIANVFNYQGDILAF